MDSGLDAHIGRRCLVTGIRVDAVTAMTDNCPRGTPPQGPTRAHVGSHHSAARDSVTRARNRPRSIQHVTGSNTA
jgi:hypothetical protein